MPPPADGFATRFVLGPALRAQPDRRLVSLVRDGYETAFEEIVRRYGKPLARYAAAIVGARGEDVTQDAFSKALLALRRDGSEIELRPWLFRIVRNTALNELRDNPPSPEMLAEAIAGGSNPAEEIERREELADLMRRLRSLPEPQRAAIVMREIEGLGHEEIAAALGVSDGAARQAIHRARQALRNGAGMLVPLPLLQALLAGGTTGTAEVAAGAGGVAGAGVALKAAAATVLVAGAVGAGVAIHDGRHAGHGQQSATAKSAPADSTAAEAAFTAPSSTDANGSGSELGDDHGRGEREPGDDHGGHGKEPGDDHGGRSGDDHQGGHIEAVDDDHGDSNSGSSNPGGRSGPSGTAGRGGPGPSGDDGGSSGSDGGRGSSQGSGSSHGGGPAPSGGSGHGGSGSGDGTSSGGGSGSSGSPGPSGSQEPAVPAVDSGGPGPSEGSGSDDESSPGDGSSGGGDDHGGD